MTDDNKVVTLGPKLLPIQEMVVELFNTAATDLAPRGKFKAALAMTLRAAAIDPNAAPIWANIGNYLWNLRRFDEAHIAVQRALQIEPKHSIALATMGLILESRGDLEGALRHFDQAIEAHAEPKHLLDTKWNRALLLLAMGKYKAGFKAYETRIEKAYLRSTFRPPVSVWEGEPLQGKSIFVAAEQGIGDNILSARFIPWLCEQAEKVYWCQPIYTTSLLWEFRNIPNLEFVPEGIPLKSLSPDYYMFGMSLPLRYGCTLGNLPPDPGYIKKRVDELDEAVKLKVPTPLDNNPVRIGICWTGNPLMDRNEERSIPLDLFLELTTIPRVWLTSFQVGSAARKIQELGAEQLILDMSQELETRGLAACGAAMQEMDLIITSCTMTAHLAGALGLNCWVLLSQDPYWIWMRGCDRTPWWPTLRLFRQKRSKDWGPVFVEVRKALVEYLEQKGVAHPVRATA